MEKNEVITLEDRGFIRAKGSEAKDFLQNIVTNNIEKVTPESTLFSSSFSFVEMILEPSEANLLSV